MIEENLHCANCGNKLEGSFCHQCGEKVISEKDFSLFTIFKNAVDSFVNLDGKIFKTAIYLFTKPGFLVKEYINGRRVPYMKPFQVFIWCNVIFFFFLGTFDIFLIPSKWFFGYYSQGHIQELVTEISNKKGITVDELAFLYDQAVTTNSKLFIILIAPILAFSTYFFAKGPEKQYGKNFIFALYLLSFFLILTVISSAIIRNIPFHFPNAIVNSLVVLIFIFYIYKSLQQFLTQNIILRIWNTIVVSLVFIALELSYRYFISYTTLKYI